MASFLNRSVKVGGKEIPSNPKAKTIESYFKKATDSAEVDSDDKKWFSAWRPLYIQEIPIPKKPQASLSASLHYLPPIKRKAPSNPFQSKRKKSSFVFGEAECEDDDEEEEEEDEEDEEEEEDEDEEEEEEVAFGHAQLYALQMQEDDDMMCIDEENETKKADTKHSRCIVEDDSEDEAPKPLVKRKIVIQDEDTNLEDLD